ncbi:sulfurtransferase [Shewanella sp. SG41-4]|uniref:rhodanese-like domain-containing protein n=1 Tax=Shewanella sp. SG41-4 TaxID=2760976 RepID=UPI0015FFB007|nr:sulfurtransferase [Shewanella sp. SG41-4]
MNFPLVTTDWLAQHLEDPELVLLDASMEVVLGKEPLVYDELYVIPGALSCHIDRDFFDHHSSQTHAMPNEKQFIHAAQALGINHNSTVVIYDDQGIYSAPRAWWTFKAMGFDKVFVLDGGLPQWRGEGRDTVRQFASAINLGDIKGRQQQHKVCDTEFILTHLGHANVDIIDARAAGRFNGTSPEPRVGMRSGHIPGSLNLPFAQVLNGFKMKPIRELHTIFANLDASHNAQRVFSCGSGITACILILASYAAGHHQAALYDGSWAVWGGDAALPIE